MQTAILIGIGAGLASAALHASAWTGTALGLFVLFFLSPLPVAIAGLGWGWGAGFLAASVGTLTAATAATLLALAAPESMLEIALVRGLRSGIVYFIALGVPAAVFSYLLLLNRTDSDGSVEWYPIGRVVMWATVWAGITATAGMLSLGTDFASVKAAILDMLERSLFVDGAGPGAGKVSPAQKSQFAALMTAFMPWALATIWFSVALINLWVGARVTAQSGLLARPWPELSALTLPPGMGFAFAVCVLGMLVPDMPGLVAACFSSALLFAFMLVGLGVLHRLTRGYSVRPFLLGSVYAGLLFLPPFANIAVALVGVAEPYLRRRLPPGAGPPGPGALN